MWLEFLANLSIGSVAIGIGGGVLACVFYRSELKRVVRIARAEIESRLPKKRPSIEIALHADLEVDMAWWDDEFAKLQQADISAVASSWLTTKEQLLVNMFQTIQDAQPPTTEEFERWYRSGIKSVTEGNVTYNVSPSDGAKRMAVEDGIRASLEHGVIDCEFCEYVEHRTYASSVVRRFKTGLCWECAERDKNGRKSIATLSSAGYALGAGYITFADAESIIEEISRRA